jgi:starvation-inducible DNA-binding protein
MKKTEVNQILNGIGLQDRKKIAQGLSHLLADSYTLYLQTHAFHWNVEGPMFNTLHLMFMEQYNELWLALDMIAERIRALDFVAPGSYKEFAQLTSIAEVAGAPEAMTMVSILAEGHAAVASTARKLFPIAEAANDQVTVDLLTQRLQVHEKTNWMLRVLLK